jgi:prevent-host-death family protein
MSKVISALTARTQFGQILKRATEKNERFVVDRSGEPSVIIMSVADYVKTIAPPPEWLEAVWAESKRKGTDKLTPREINAEIAAARREQRGKKAGRPAKK